MGKSSGERRVILSSSGAIRTTWERRTPPHLNAGISKPLGEREHLKLELLKEDRHEEEDGGEGDGVWSGGAHKATTAVEADTHIDAIVKPSLSLSLSLSREFGVAGKRDDDWDLRMLLPFFFFFFFFF